MIEPLVSIIVPIYNVGPFVEKCISSLILQDYKNTEIILVDDGSTDDSGTIVDKFKNIKNARIIHKVNMGVSAARNDGLRIANGKYVMFVDGDDYVDTDYVSYFVNLIEKNKCEMGVDYRYYYNDADRDNGYTPKIIIKEAEKIIEQIYLGNIGVAVWNKIYRKDILVENNLFFNENYWFAEGMLFNILYLQYANTVVVGNKKVYHSVENTHSATRLFNLKSWLCGLRSMEYQRDHWIKINKDIQMSWEYHYRKYAESILRGIISNNLITKYKDVYDMCINLLKKNIRIPIQANISNLEKDEAIRLKICPYLVLTKKLCFRDCRGFCQFFYLFQIKLFNKIPKKIKYYLYNKARKYYVSNYKQTYLRSHYFESRYNYLDNIQ